MIQPFVGSLALAMRSIFVEWHQLDLLFGRVLDGFSAARLSRMVDCSGVVPVSHIDYNAD
jgi:hypothetical protein